MAVWSSLKSARFALRPISSVGGDPSAFTFAKAIPWSWPLADESGKFSFMFQDSPVEVTGVGVTKPIRVGREESGLATV